MKTFEELKKIDSHLQSETGLHFRQIPVVLKIKRQTGWRYLYDVKKGRVLTARTVGGACIYNGVSHVLAQHINILKSKKIEYKILAYTKPIDITEQFLNTK